MPKIKDLTGQKFGRLTVLGLEDIVKHKAMWKCRKQKTDEEENHLTENDIQNQIRIALSQHGVVFRTNSGDFWQGERIYYPPLRQNILINLRRVQGLPAGFSDLLYCGFDGRAGFIEVKRPGGHIRKEQQHFLMLMSSYGYPAGIARSPEEALKIIHGLKSQNE